MVQTLPSAEIESFFAEDLEIDFEPKRNELRQTRSKDSNEVDPEGLKSVLIMMTSPNILLKGLRTSFQ